MPFAASVPWKNCYIYDQLGEGQGDGIGWPLSLNGTEIAKHGATNPETSSAD